MFEGKHGGIAPTSATGKRSRGNASVLALERTACLKYSEFLVAFVSVLAWPRMYINGDAYRVNDKYDLF